ncbi:hypothetical protein EMIT0P218_20037 [Pseudomonas sp. IT-P218]
MGNPPVGASLLAKNQRTPRGVRFPASSLASIVGAFQFTGRDVDLYPSFPGKRGPVRNECLRPEIVPANINRYPPLGSACEPGQLISTLAKKNTPQRGVLVWLQFTEVPRRDARWIKA